MKLTQHDLSLLINSIDNTKLSFREQTEIQYVFAKLYRIKKEQTDDQEMSEKTEE